MTTAVVFANSNVGARCLAVLLAERIHIPLVVTHRTSPEDAAFENVEAIARAHALSVELAEDANAGGFAARVEALAPDFIFSFYYRQLLPERVLNAAQRGALNMHGSLLPKYRGRVPVNWAVIRGERETGATLHYMTARSDAGDIVDQQAVPILADDTAFEVLTKVTVAAELVLWRSLPALIRGDAPRHRQDPALATYFGRRRPEDGCIDWRDGAAAIHDLVRGVAPPYPGAYTALRGRALRLLKTRHALERKARSAVPSLYVENDACYIDCADGGVLRLLDAELDGVAIEPQALPALLGVQGTLALRSEGEKETL